MLVRCVQCSNVHETSADYLKINKIVFVQQSRPTKKQQLTNDVDLSAGGVNDDVIRQGQRPITGGVIY